MSDSDDFDKEAEREKLREQFDSSDEGREVTERMSDLLLKGATMTNRHCPECGSPIFRHEDQEFCPTCQRPVQDPETEATGEKRQSHPNQQVQADEQSPQATGEQGDAEGAGLRSTDSASADPAMRNDAGGAGRVDQPGAPGRTDQSGAPGRATQPDTPGTTEQSGDLGAAETALARTLTALARRAEETGDVGRKRECLAAAREAAEALAATRRARR